MTARLYSPFSFHINVVSFLPPLSSPALLRTSPRSVAAHYQGLPSHPDAARRTKVRGSLAETFSFADLRGLRKLLRDTSTASVPLAGKE